MPPEELWEWQRHALEAWQAKGRKGIIAAATGTGKTRLALAAIEFLKQEFGSSLRVLVVVPTVRLQKQWVGELRGRLGYPYGRLGQLGGGEYTGGGTHDCVVAVINSAREGGPGILEKWGRRSCSTFLIVDECHRAGSPKNRQVFEGPYRFSLGLSATPERQGDYALGEVIIPALGPIVYRYGRAEAETQGIISPLDLVQVHIPLRNSEETKYQELTTKIDQIRSALQDRYPRLWRVDDLIRAINALKSDQIKETGTYDDLIDEWNKKVASRRLVLVRADFRHQAAVDIAAAFDPSERVLMFHQEIRALEALAHELSVRGYRVGTYHSQMGKADRVRAFEEFSSGQVPWLASALALDEGIDIPAVSAAIVVAGTYSTRQSIQRLGRLVRKAGRDRAFVFRVVTEHEISRVPYTDIEGKPIASRYGRLSWPDQRHALSDTSALEPLLMTWEELLEELGAGETQPDGLLCSGCDALNTAWDNHPDVTPGDGWRCSQCQTALTGRCWRCGRFTVPDLFDNRRCSARWAYKGEDIGQLWVPKWVQGAAQQAHFTHAELVSILDRVSPNNTQFGTRGVRALVYEYGGRRVVVDPKLGYIVEVDRTTIDKEWVDLS